MVSATDAHADSSDCGRPVTTGHDPREAIAATSPRRGAGLIGFLGAHFLPALFAGIMLGFGARAVMRVIALASGLPGSFSVGGSSEVILLGALVGLPIALGFFALRGRVPLRTPYPGAFLGILLFLALALRPPPSARSALAGTPDLPVATALLFCGLFLLFGIGLEWRWARWQSVVAPSAGPTVDG